MKRLKMKLIKVKITPHSSFVTFPKGDTIFGHFAYHSFLKGEEYFKNYTDEEPKIIFSDILPDGYLYKPTLPLSAFGVDESEKKEFRKKSWIAIEPLKGGELIKAEAITFYKSEVKVRNSLNRVTFATGGEGFDPFSIEELTFTYQPVIYVLFDTEIFNEKEIEDRLNLIGNSGFGKKGSIGKGHFSAKVEGEFKAFDEVTSEYYLTLSPTILNKQPHIEKAYYNTFNRFGKSHGSSTPFKKPLLMADSGAVLKLKEKRAYIGRGVENGINQQSLVQGFSIVFPFEFKGELDG
jgi:CRISPR-associated protein Csm4